ncbi:MAG TPA: hypothetical protein VGV69_01165 [Solirubrobacterales bacterium]|nr:hypothetical protein [Solirubrobacterales bacterium]
MPTSITISAEERDLLYGRIVIRLTGIDDVYRAVEGGDWEAAQRLGQEFSDLLRLVCADLGWGETAPEALTLTTPADVLHRAATSLRDWAAEDRAYFDRDPGEALSVQDEARRLAELCDRILSCTGP